ncbi:apolipoprotein D-like [Panonychus citri]|uniref:apolipoprotein D-like n=1 Tax=Panonychus citri TaxID=50023 RepID=UPI0023075B94|nr:apolipoprotein D-like [Panonychus citri]
MKVIAVVLLIVSSSFALIIKGPGCPSPYPPKKGFKVNKYLGNWYEIERSQTPHEDGVRCNTANYVLNSVGGINITNSGIDNTGHETATTLIATQILPNIPNYFAVFLDPQLPPASYWIVDTDYENYAAVACCYQISQYVQVFLGYVLSRERTIDSSVRSALEKTLYDIGVNQMYETDQTNCDSM